MNKSELVDRVAEVPAGRAPRFSAGAKLKQAVGCRRPRGEGNDQVAQRKAQTTRATGRRQPAAAGGQAALERLNASVEAAQAALKELRGELDRGSRELLHDVDVTLRDARKNLRRVSRQLVKDLEAVQHAAAGKRPRAQATKATRRSSSRGATTAAKRTRGT